MRLSQLIKYSMQNIFLETSYTKCGGEASSRPQKIKIEDFSESKG